MNIENIIKEGIQQGFKDLFDTELKSEQISLQPTNQEFEGTFTFVMFPFSKITRKSPEEGGKILGEYLKTHLKEISEFNVVKGFLNISIASEVWLELFRSTIVLENFTSIPAKRQTVLVEYSSPNTNKPLHLGHLRNNFLGYAVSEILKANGYNVIKANLINDRGIHICKSMVAYRKFGNLETPESAQIKGDHLIGKYYVLFDKEYKREIEELVLAGKSKEEAEKEAPIFKEAQEMLLKWEQEDKEVRELWARMNGWVYEGFEATYKAIGVDFDKYYYESDTYLLGKEVVEEGLQKNIFFRKPDGSVWVDLTSDGLDQKLILRADGTSVYITQDLGTADLKFKDFKSDRSVYVVGNEQDYHFNVLKLILKKLGRSYAEGIFHLSYGMVDLPSGKMKSREGTVVDADELVEEMIETAERQTAELGKIDGFTTQEAEHLYKVLAMGALKYFLLKVDPKKRMLFNPQESIEFQGNTGPFIQYTYARISAIGRKAAELKLDIDINNYKNLSQLHDSEQELIAHLNVFPKKIAEAGQVYAPSIIAQYAFDLAKAYNRFYAEVSIFSEDNKEALIFRIALSLTVARIIKQAMKLLGIEVPERM